jgi:GT2 family glycosyltransferase
MNILSKNKYKVLVVLLTYKRLERLNVTLKNLNNQSYKYFHLNVSHGDPSTKNDFIKIIKKYENIIDMSYSIDENSFSSFRRFAIAKKFTEDNLADIVIFIDDDIEFDENFIKKYVENFEPKTIKANHVLHIYDGSSYFENRLRVTKNNEDFLRADVALGQCGMFDSKIFLDPRLFLNLDDNIIKFSDDLWISYVATNLLNWKIKPLEVDSFKDLGHDEVALSRIAYNNGNIRQVCVDYLVSLGWLK